MIFKGFQKTSLIDFPGRVSSVVFTEGCNFRCPYCHNPELVLPEKFNETRAFSEEEVLAFLKKRKSVVDGVCVTGGEPTLHRDLPSFFEKTKEIGMENKLDTNGTNWRMLKELIDGKLVDFVAMDIKAPLEQNKYFFVTKNGDQKLFESVKKSASLLMEAGIEYQFRTTALPHFTPKRDLIQISENLDGAKSYCLQKFVPGKTSDPSMQWAEGFTEKELKKIAEEMGKKIKSVTVRS